MIKMLLHSCCMSQTRLVERLTSALDLPSLSGIMAVLFVIIMIAALAVTLSVRRQHSITKIMTSAACHTLSHTCT